jgi:hypothetical protein
MKLEGIPVGSESQEGLDFWHTSTQTHQIDLHITIIFNEQWESLKDGRIKFGLKGGELRLKLENGEIPYEYRKLSGSFKLSIPKKGKNRKLVKTKRAQRWVRTLKILL